MNLSLYLAYFSIYVTYLDGLLCVGVRFHVHVVGSDGRQLVAARDATQRDIVSGFQMMFDRRTFPDRGQQRHFSLQIRRVDSQRGRQTHHLLPTLLLRHSVTTTAIAAVVLS